MECRVRRKILFGICLLASGFLFPACAHVSPAGQVGTGYINAIGFPALFGPITGYNLYISERSGKDYKRFNKEPITSQRYEVRGLQIGKRYYFVFTSLAKSNGVTVESRPSQEFYMDAR